MFPSHIAFRLYTMINRSGHGLPSLPLAYKQQLADVEHGWHLSSLGFTHRLANIEYELQTSCVVAQTGIPTSDASYTNRL